jgi:hypothetical protein
MRRSDEEVTMDEERSLIRRAAMPGAVLVLAVGVAFGLYRLFGPQPPAAPPQAGARAVPAPAPPPESVAKFPLPGESPEAAMAAPAEAPADARAAFERDVAGLADPATFGRFFELATLVRRLVSTVDNIASDELPLRARAVLPMRGAFVVAKGADGPTIDASNARRYEPFVKLVESIDTRRAVEVYVAHYRLFQGEYRGQGSPNRYFNDRVVAAIDHLLATPDVKGPIRLVQPKVLYRYADPELEALSAGQKALLRMGPENAARIKAKLRAVRAEIARQGRTGPGGSR